MSDRKTEYSERKEKQAEQRFVLAKNLQKELKSTTVLLNIPKGFEIKFSDLESDIAKHNRNLGSFHLARITYKEQMVALVRPNFLDSYGEQSLDKKLIFLEVHGMFYDYIMKIVELKKYTGNGWSDEEQEEFYNKFITCDSDFASLQECFDNLEERRVLIHTELKNFFDSDVEYERYDPNAYVKCKDKFGQELVEGDYADVQQDGAHIIYKKDDGQLYFKPYGKEDRVCAYASNDIVKCDQDGEWVVADKFL